MNWRQKIAGWLTGATQKGSIEPFNKIPSIDSTIGDKLRNPYANSVWVQRAIKKVAQPIAAVPLCFLSGDALAEENEIESPELTAFWRNPVRGLTYTDFIEASVGWLKIAGEVFCVLDDRALLPAAAMPFPEAGRTVPPLILARPDRMRHLVSGGQLLGWQYLDGDGRQHNLLPQQVIHIRNWNPYDEWRGLGELESAMIAADADYLAGKYNQNLMRSNGDRGPYAIAKNGIPTKEQQEQIIAALRQKAQMAASGNFRPVFLSGDITIEDPKVQGLDVNVIATRLQNRHEIFIAFGVPPSMVDVVASYSVGSASDRFVLIEETCIPTATKLADGMSKVSRIVSRLNVTVECDFDEHSTMQAVRRERLDAATKMWDRGASWEDCNDYLRLGMKPFEGWDKRYLPFGLQPVDAADSEPSKPLPEPGSPAANEEQDPVDALKAIFKGRKPKVVATPQCHCCAGPAVPDKEFDARAKLKREKIRKVLFAQRQRVLSKLERLFSTRAIEVKAFDDLYDNEQERRAFEEALKPALIDDLKVGGARLWKQLGKVEEFRIPPQIADSFWQQRAKHIGHFSDNVSADVLESLREALANGETFEDMASRVRAIYNDLSQGRAETIAQTETQVAVNTGEFEGAKQVGIEKKSWHTSNLANVRASHLDAEQRSAAGIPINEPFSNGLMYPGDPFGDPGEVINCRCFVTYDMEDKES